MSAASGTCLRAFHCKERKAGLLFMKDICAGMWFCIRANLRNLRIQIAGALFFCKAQAQLLG